MIHNENSRVKIPALIHLTRLGYDYLSLKQYEGHICPETNTVSESDYTSYKILVCKSRIEESNQHTEECDNYQKQHHLDR